MGDRAAESMMHAETVEAAEPVNFEEFFQTERDRLFAMLFVITRDRAEAEEIAQDAFLALWERWAGIDDLEDPTAYLTSTAMNIFRKRYRRAAILRRILPAVSRRTVESSTRADARLELSEALGELTPRQRAALVLTEILGYSAAEAGRLMRVESSTVGALKYQARATLNDAERDDG